LSGHVERASTKIKSTKPKDNKERLILGVTECGNFKVSVNGNPSYKNPNQMTGVWLDVLKDYRLSFDNLPLILISREKEKENLSTPLRVPSQPVQTPQPQLSVRQPQTRQLLPVQQHQPALHFQPIANPRQITTTAEPPQPLQQPQTPFRQLQQQADPSRPARTWMQVLPPSNPHPLPATNVAQRGNLMQKLLLTF